VAVAAWFMVSDACAQKNASHSNGDDALFLALRDAARRDDAAKSGELAARLPHYAIASYVDYYRLKPRLANASEAEIRDFLTRYADSAIADRLRNDWLLELGRKRRWASFDAEYPLFVLDDDFQLKCYALVSAALKGQSVLEPARALLVSPKDYGEACHVLIGTLVQEKQWGADEVWMQIRLAAENGAIAPARRLAAWVGADEVAIEQAFERPGVTIAKGVGSSREAHELYLIALGRLAKTQVEQAARALITAEQKLTAREQALAWAQIALQASYQLAPQAHVDYWSRVDDAPLSNEGYQWRVRMALRAGDWPSVQSGIEAMPAALRGQPVWIYWMGRAYNAQGRREEAQALFQSIADQVHFYGQLALEESGRKISIPPAPSAVTKTEIAAMTAHPGLGRALKFFAMNLRFEGVREWNWALRSMNEREHLAAAELARQNNLLDRMVNTSDRTKSMVDFTQRFPAPFRDFVHRTTQALGLEMAWVYGLIRQESRFIMQARSQVGASGLMQLMPATAHFVARKIGMHHFRAGQLNDTQTNIELGSHYLSMVLSDLDGSQAMASAAYNAGPARPRAWRATLTQPVEGAIFAESIPFAETRGYVKNVLSNATYYAALFEGHPQSLKARLGVIMPKNYRLSALSE